MQQQRLDEKLILPLSVSPSLSLSLSDKHCQIVCLSCVFLSVRLFLCSKSAKHCAVICYLYTAMIHSPRFPDSEQGILSAQVSCQERST